MTIWKEPKPVRKHWSTSLRTLLLLMISAVSLATSAPAIAQGVPSKLLRQRQCQESLPASIRYSENRGRWLMNLLSASGDYCLLTKVSHHGQTPLSLS